MLTIQKFYTYRCNPCRDLRPILDKVCDDLNIELISLDCGANPPEVDYESFGVKSVPTVIIYLDGVEMKRFTGFKTEREILDIIQSI